MTFTEYIDFIDGQATSPNPNKPPAPTAPPSAIIGSAVPRIDGPLKTTGTARYAADFNFPRMVYAVPVCATVASGAIKSLDTTRAESMPGVLLVLHHGNIGPLFRNASGGRNSEQRPPFEDQNVYYWGQYVAVAIAETFEQAQAAAAAVRVQYFPTPFNVDFRLDDPPPAHDHAQPKGAEHPTASAAVALDAPVPPPGPQVVSHRGDPAAAFAAAPVQLDHTYTTPVETHNPMEMHATVAVFRDGKFTLYETSQGVVNHHTVMAQVLGVPNEDLEVVTHFLGSGFGGKLFPWPHSALAAAAARQLNRPVKLTVSRKMMFTNVGHRPKTQQRIRLGASHDGKLLSLQHDYRNHTSMLDDIRENCGEATPFLYSTPNLSVSTALVRRNTGTPTPMRGPGAVPGLFALESAIDELALKLNQDPVAFRLGLDTLTDEEKNKPFSSRHLRECLEVGSQKFGWSNRTPAVGSMRGSGAKSDLILGYGVACASWGAGRGGAEATLALRADGSARISSATQDVGTGTYTILAQIVADKTGIPTSKIEVVLGESSLVPGPMSGGSTATATIVPAVADACAAAIKNLLSSAPRAPGSPFSGKKPEDLAMSAGRIHLKGQPPSSGLPFEQILRSSNLQSARGDGKSGGLGSDTKARDYSTHSFGAQFVEVEWDPGIAHLRVSRVVSVIDGGRILNKLAATNQVAGAVVMGVGMGLLEQTVYDPRNGHPVNDNFADYLVPTAADSPLIDVHFLDIPDPMMGEYGARGIGEIGLAGVAPAITAAVYHATGVRVRDLPVRIEDLLTAKV